ncbi:MAG TPA: hypothetical protein VN642_15090 [Dongiaceae bacterium]|nr:hypothetical protein [Dongiaceae bacterium]
MKSRACISRLFLYSYTNDITPVMKLAKGEQGMVASLPGMSRQTLNNRLKVTGRTE